MPPSALENPGSTGRETPGPASPCPPRAVPPVPSLPALPASSTARCARKASPLSSAATSARSTAQSGTSPHRNSAVNASSAAAAPQSATTPIVATVSRQSLHPGTPPQIAPSAGDFSPQIHRQIQPLTVATASRQSLRRIPLASPPKCPFGFAARSANAATPAPRLPLAPPSAAPPGSAPAHPSAVPAVPLLGQPAPESCLLIALLSFAVLASRICNPDRKS